MRLAAAATVALYFIVLIVLTVPVGAVSFYAEIPLPKVFDIFEVWEYWVWLVIMVLCAAALLLIPLRMAQEKPISKRSIWVPTIASGFLLGCMFLGIVCAVAEFLQQDTLFHKSWQGWGALAGAVFVWIAWSVAFYLYTRVSEPAHIVELHNRWLFRVSLLGLLIAVPTHIVARHRDYCCAGFGTFVCLAFGIPIMLFSFGPSIFLLFASRWRRVHPQGK